MKKQYSECEQKIIKDLVYSINICKKRNDLKWLKIYIKQLNYITQGIPNNIKISF